VKKGDREAVVTITLPQEPPFAAPYRQAVEAFQKRDLPAARQELEKVVALKPDLQQAHAFLALILEALHDSRAAAAAAQRAVELKSDDQQSYAILATARVELRDFAGAAAAAERSLELKPTDQASLSLLAYARVELRDYAAAQIAVEKALALKPDDLEALRSRYDVYSGLNDETQRLQALHDLLARDRRTDNAVLAYNEGVRFWNAKSYDRAKEMGELATSVNPKLVQAWVLLARAELARQDANAALAAADHALEVQPSERPALELKLEALRALKQTAKAKEVEAALKALGKTP